MSLESELVEALNEALAEAELRLNDEEQRLAVRHARMLLETNRRTNLTRITEPGAVMRRHFVESFLAAELWGPAPEGRPLRVLDVGSGGGFPGLAGRIRRPDVALTCLEPRAAKAAFLSRVASELRDPRPRVLTRRIEEFHVEQVFDVVTFRALSVPMDRIERVLSPSGRIVGFPGGEETWSAAIEAAEWVVTEWRDIPAEERRVSCWTRNH